MPVAGMRCESCGGDSFVFSTRIKSKIMNAIYRRRRCKKCNHVWGTYEVNADFIDYLEANKSVLIMLKNVRGTIDQVLKCTRGNLE